MWANVSKIGPGMQNWGYVTAIRDVTSWRFLLARLIAKTHAGSSEQLVGFIVNQAVYIGADLSTTECKCTTVFTFFYFLLKMELHYSGILYLFWVWAAGEWEKDSERSVTG